MRASRTHTAPLRKAAKREPALELVGVLAAPAPDSEDRPKQLRTCLGDVRQKVARETPQLRVFHLRIELGHDGPTHQVLADAKAIAIERDEGMRVDFPVFAGAERAQPGRALGQRRAECRRAQKYVV